MATERDTLTVHVPAKAAWTLAIGLLVSGGSLLFWAGTSYEALQTVVKTQEALVKSHQKDHDLVITMKGKLESHGLWGAAEAAARNPEPHGQRGR